MDLWQVIARARKEAVDNSPAILTAIGVTGAITTAVLAGRGGIKAARILAEESPNLEPREKVQLTWKVFVPSAVTATVTVVCIVTANSVSAKRSAALASAYAVTERAYHEYRAKVTDKFGEAKAKKISDEIAQDHVNRDPPSVYIASNMTSLWKDLYTGRYFDCDMESIRSAVNDINEDIYNGGYPSLTDFWEKIGLGRTSDSDEFGWNADNKLEVYYAAAVHDGRPVGTIEFRATPVRNNYKLY